MNYIIITNNPRVQEEFENTMFINGSFEDVLIKVRDLVHFGHKLINHPLGASIRIMFSPYRSIIVGRKTENINEVYVESIENSIANYRKHMKIRMPDTINKEDYAVIDMELLKSALEEAKKLSA